jgi:tetratricopeptide (TPR) repeat protein
MVAAALLNSRRLDRIRSAAIASLIAWQYLGCAVAPTPNALTQGGTFRIREVTAEGDPQQRASTRLALAGLATEDPQHAVSQYERAIKTDATNPYAYLALAAYEIQWGDVERGEQALSRAMQMLQPERLHSPRVVPHLDGLRGRARIRRANGSDATSNDSLDRAKRAAPEAWGDGWLMPEELR